jgi:hypothetical protein
MNRKSKGVSAESGSGRGKRISLAPLTFEVALEKFVQVPPPADDKALRRPTSKKKRAKKARREK